MHATWLTYNCYQAGADHFRHSRPDEHLFSSHSKVFLFTQWLVSIYITLMYHITSKFWTCENCGLMIDSFPLFSAWAKMSKTILLACDTLDKAWVLISSLILWHLIIKFSNPSLTTREKISQVPKLRWSVEQLVQSRARMHFRPTMLQLASRSDHNINKRHNGNNCQYSKIW